ncbi:MAG: FAD-dependent oxidoreductase, partial [Streptosporangiaceae bacterium]
SAIEEATFLTKFAKSVIVATGSGYRELGIPNEKRLSGKGVSWCATCDGFFFRDQEIVVVGGGDTAMEEAIFLTKFAHVTVVHRRDSLRASKIMQDRAFANERISFVWDSEVIDVLGEDRVKAVRLRNLKTGAEADLEVTGLFIAIGHDPRSELFEGQLDKDEEGYLTVTAPTTHTRIPGVFACGDVVDHIYRQAITAAASGCSAAIDAERYLQEA